MNYVNDGITFVEARILKLLRERNGTVKYLGLKR
jgi:hypothetical protein